MERTEAIEVIRKNWPDASFTQLREALETLIPEFKESEDERIYNEIMEFFKMNEKRCIVDNSYTRWIAWLKKQKKSAVEGKGLYYYDGEKFTYCGYPATEENPYDFAMSQQEQPDKDKKTFDDYLKASPSERRKMNMAEILGEEKFVETKKQMEQPEVDLENTAQHVYESWMGDTMDDVRRDMVELGKVLNARKEDK